MFFFENDLDVEHCNSYPEPFVSFFHVTLSVLPPTAVTLEIVFFLGVTVIIILAAALLYVDVEDAFTVIVHIPVPFIVTFPFLSTDATFLFEEM